MSINKEYQLMSARATHIVHIWCRRAPSDITFMLAPSLGTDVIYIYRCDNDVVSTAFIHPASLESFEDEIKAYLKSHKGDAPHLSMEK